jgi:hypothetical protein
MDSPNCSQNGEHEWIRMLVWRAKNGHEQIRCSEEFGFLFIS